MNDRCILLVTSHDPHELIATINRKSIRQCLHSIWVAHAQCGFEADVILANGKVIDLIHMLFIHMLVIV